MSKKQTFSTSSFDKLINDSIIESDQLKNQLQTVNLNGDISFNNTDIDDYLPENDKAFSEKNNIISDEGDSVCYSYIYKKIGDLVDTGNASLQMLQSIDPDVTDPSMLAATGSLINSIRGCISEFTKIHNQYIRFQQAIKLEKIKLDHKKELTKYRTDLRNGTLSDGDQVSELFELGSTDLIEFLQWKKEKEEREREKDEKM
jgi:hypothetical protein